MISDDRFDDLHDDVRYIRTRVDSIEHRLTKVEVKSSIFGVVGGFLAGLAALIFRE